MINVAARIGRRYQQECVAGRKDNGNASSQHDGTEKQRQLVARYVKDDGFGSGATDNFASAKEAWIRSPASDRQQRECRLDDDDAYHHPRNRPSRSILVLGRKELLVHTTLAKQQKERWHGNADNPEPIVPAKNCGVLCWEFVDDSADTTKLPNHVRQRQNDSH